MKPFWFAKEKNCNKQAEKIRHYHTKFIRMGQPDIVDLYSCSEPIYPYMWYMISYEAHFLDF
jgi:hypothetical protein